MLSSTNIKNYIKLFFAIIIALNCLSIYPSYATVNMSWIEWVGDITNHSISISTSWDITTSIKNTGFEILTIIKYIMSAVLVIMIVYIGIQMIMSMWNDEEKLSSAKRQIRYTLIWLIFINIPWSLYKIFEKSTNTNVSSWIVNTWANTPSSNIFVNAVLFNSTINNWIIVFVESMLTIITIFMIMLAGINIMTSRWREEKVTEAKEKILWSLIWLMFIWFIESWKLVVYKWEISDWANLFQTMEELALFFAGPVAIFFLTLAGYYYITSNGDEDKVKKAKSIIINTVIAVIILLFSHAFLKDLITL